MLDLFVIYYGAIQIIPQLLCGKKIKLGHARIFMAKNKQKNL